MAEKPFGLWVREKRLQAGWKQRECVDRVNAYYEREEAHLAPEDRSTFSRSAWGKMETGLHKERVFPKTVLHVSIGLRLPYSECMAAAGYTVNDTTDDVAVSIGRNLTLLQSAIGMSSEQVALALGIPAERYALFESGNDSPDASQVVQLSTILNTTVNQIFEGRAGTSSIASTRPALSSSVTKADITSLHQKLDAILRLLEQDQKQAG